MAWTDTQRDALRNAIATGVLSVTFNNRTVQYQSLKEMRELLAEMEGSVSATGRNYRLAVTSKMGHAAETE